VQVRVYETFGASVLLHPKGVTCLLKGVLLPCFELCPKHIKEDMVCLIILFEMSLQRARIDSKFQSSLLDVQRLVQLSVLQLKVSKEARAWIQPP